MAIYVEEEEVWKCPKHHSKRRRNGVCPACLRDRLGSLCPDCGAIRPCNCPCPSSSSGEPSFRRSRSLAIPFLRSNNAAIKTPSFLSGLMRSKTTKTDPLKRANDGIGGGGDHENSKIEDFARMVTRSRSVSAAATLTASGSRRRPKTYKFWNFSSPFKAFRTSKTPNVLQDRSIPLHGG